MTVTLIYEPRGLINYFGDMIKRVFVLTTQIQLPPKFAMESKFLKVKQGNVWTINNSAKRGRMEIIAEILLFCDHNKAKTSIMYKTNLNYAQLQSQLKFLPEGHTDFVFAVFAEEWGFLGVLVLLGLFAGLIWLALEIALKAKDMLGALLAAGLIAMLAFCLVINIGMTAGLFPIVGIPLPLMSYGGSSIVATMSALGLLLNIKRRRLTLFY